MNKTNISMNKNMIKKD